MDLKKLVNYNQSIKIIPSIEESLQRDGFDTNLDVETIARLEKIKNIWTLWKKADSVKCEIENLLQCTSEPYHVALAVVLKLEEYKDSKPNTLPYYIIQILSGLPLHNAPQPDDKLKYCAFQIAIQQRNQSFITLIIKTYNISTINRTIVPIIKDMISKGNHKVVSHMIGDLELFNEMPAKDLLFPLILQDKTNLVYDYLKDCPITFIEPFIQFLDGLLHKDFQLLPFVQDYITENNIANFKYDKLHPKPLGKFLGKLCSKFKYPVSKCVNLSRHRTFSGLRYLVYQKYLDNNITASVWEDLVKDTLNQSPDCAQDFINFLAEYDTKEALKWAENLNISKQNYPDILKSPTQYSPPVEEECWDNEPRASQQFYRLPLKPEAIIIIDTIDNFKTFLTEIRFSTLLGIDCEWKPSFGTTQLQVALIQISTRENVYLLDVLSLNGQECIPLWQTFQNDYLNNCEIMKLGFGLENDLKEMKSSISGLSNMLLKGEGFLDLSLLWKRISDLNVDLPYTNDGCSLSSLVKCCFNLPLEKAERCSNWELRPLRQSQIEYAALDSYVLLEIYTFLQNLCTQQKINFDEICTETMLEVKPKNKKEKVEQMKELLTCGERKPVGAIKLLLESKLVNTAYNLRCLGIDTEVFPKTMEWHEVIYKAISDERYIVVSKLKVSPSPNYPQGNILKLNKESLKNQLSQVITYFKILITKSDTMSRCIFCNDTKLTKLTVKDIGDLYDKYKLGGNMNNYNTNVHDAYDEEPDYGNFLSDSDDDHPPPPTQAKGIPKTSLGVSIEFNNFGSLYESKEEAFLCESCGNFLWKGNETVAKTLTLFKDIL